MSVSILRSIIISAVLAIASGAAGLDPAQASKPVPKTIKGCVFNGGFVSSDGYDIHPRDARGQAVDLRSFEGHTLTMTGDLLPGDAFIVKGPLKDSGPCEIMRPSGTTASSQAIVLTAGNWYVHKPSKEYKDLPALIPGEQTGEGGLGLFEFVCMKANYYVLLVQPSIKLRDAEPATLSVRAATGSDKSAPVQLTFRNLYKTKVPLSRSIDWDADIHFAEAGAALMAAIKSAGELELTLAGSNYAIGVPDLGPRLSAFQRFCETGAVDNPTYFKEPQSMIRKGAQRFSLTTNAARPRRDHAQAKALSVMAVQPDLITLQAAAVEFMAALRPIKL